MKHHRSMVIIPDTHLPYEDKRAYNIMLQAVKALQPDIIVILGDYLDCKAVTGHGLKPKERALMLQDELAYGAEKIRELRKIAPKAQIFYIEGNHEFRIDRYVTKNAPALDGLFSVAKELDLDNLDIQVVRYGDFLRIDHLCFTHDLGRAGENAHRHARKKVHGNIVIGHTHRMGIEYEGSLKGPHLGAHFGWLASHKAHDDYKDKIGGMVDTTLGFGVGYAVNGIWWLTPVPIIGYKAIVPSAPLLLR
jgi:predicted phosphodiesterase